MRSVSLTAIIHSVDFGEVIYQEASLRRLGRRVFAVSGPAINIIDIDAFLNIFTID